MSTRREFLQSIGLVSGGVFLSSKAFASSSPTVNKEVGIQLWTLRDTIESDPEGTLKSLAQLGYTSIEAYGFDGSFFSRDTSHFSAFCKSLNLKITSTHTGITAQNAAGYAATAARIGMEYLVLPSMMGRPQATITDFRNTAEEMNQIGKACKTEGIKFAYHNHDFEFKPIEDQIPYDVLLANTDPSLVAFQCDLYWMVKAGKRPQEYFEKHPGRFSTWHLKDKGRDGESCIIGNGTIDFKPIIEMSETAGLERIFVEQEAYSEGSPLFCAGQSLKYIQSHLL